jgi:ribosome-binding factor A
MDRHRAERVSETIREELTEIIGFELSDPRIGTVDVTEVVVSPDMRHARIRVHLAGDDDSRQKTLEALEGARYFLRRELASRLRLYRFPDLHFEADLGVANAERIEQLLKRARKKRARNPEEPQENS